MIKLTIQISPLLRIIVNLGVKALQADNSLILERDPKRQLDSLWGSTTKFEDKPAKRPKFRRRQ